MPVRMGFLLDRVNAGERVLDVGCGEGQFAAALAAAGASVVAVDVANEPLARARSRYKHLDLRLIDPDGDWPLPDNDFDVVWAGEVIEHVLDTARFLSEVRRVLRPQGRLLLSTPAHPLLRRLALALRPVAFDEHFDPLADHLRFYTASGLRSVLGQFGFQPPDIELAGGLPCARTVMLACARRSRF